MCIRDRIQGYAEGLQEGISDDPESRAFYCDVIVDEAKKMNRMVRKLLTLNHLEFGQDALTEEPFDICEMLTTLLNSSALEMQKKEINVIKQYPASCMAVSYTHLAHTRHLLYMFQVMTSICDSCLRQSHFVFCQNH